MIDSEMPLFRQFQIERRNFRKNETVSLDKNNWIEKGLVKRKMYQNLHIKNQNGNLLHTVELSQVF